MKAVQSVACLRNRKQKIRKGICGEGSGTWVFSTQRLTPSMTPMHCTQGNFESSDNTAVINTARERDCESGLIPGGEVEKGCSLTELKI